MGFLIGGIIAIVLGIILFFVMLSKKKALFSVQSAQKRSCKELLEMAKQIADEIGAGSYNERCKLWGKVTSDNPLTAEISHQSCVYYSSSVYRKYEDYEIETDADGNETEKLVTKEDLLSSNSNKIDFDLDDGTGKVTVNLDGASMETVTVVDRFEPGETSSSTLSMGDFSFSIGGVDYGESNTLGYRYEERIIPLNRNLLVVGDVSDASGKIRVQEPSDKDYKYVISLKSEDQYISSSKKSIGFLKFFAPILTLGGAVLIVLQFIIGKK